MRIAYFDCFAGISGDMTLGALLDAGADESLFLTEMARLGHLDFELRVGKVVRHGIQATDVQVITQESHHHRRLADIEEIIESSDLSESMKARSIAIFKVLAEAEGAVHGISPKDVHFHEVGAVDAIVDIVGTALGIELLGIERVIASPMPMGRGFVEAAHGRIPLPAPATVEILKGAPVYSADVEGELVTPTGAAIVRTLASSFGGIPSMVTQSVGYGTGKSDFPFPNMLRILVGESSAEAVLPQTDRISVVETNIDDMNPEFYDAVFERLFHAGALDVYLTPIYMKKNRPATLLSVMCPDDRTDAVVRAVITETSTFGVRISSAERRCLDRRWATVSTRYGDVRLKIGVYQGEEVVASPEYEDCKKAAEAHGVSVRRVYEEAVASFHARP